MNAHSVTGPAGSFTGHLFLTFGGTGRADRLNNCPLDRVLTYKNLIYLLNLQVYIFHNISEKPFPFASYDSFTPVNNFHFTEPAYKIPGFVSKPQQPALSSLNDATTTSWF